jgi:membrane-bound lytic murein transglycosylase B
MNVTNNIAAIKIAESMKLIDARFAEIESRTGIPFTAHMVRAQNILASGGRLPAEEESFDPIHDYQPSPPPAYTPEPLQKTGGFARMPESEFDQLIADAAARYGLEPALIKAITAAESNFRPGAVSPKGAMGLMQLMPYTAEALGVEDPMDPWQNVDGGTRLIAQFLDRFDGDVLISIAAYNCGPGRITSRSITDLTDPEQRALLPQETQVYLRRIEDYLAAAMASYVLDSPFAA